MAVLDGGSTDHTATVASAAGMDVLDVVGLSPWLGAVLGKGDSLFRGVQAVPADGYIFIDADIANLSVAHVAVLVDALTATQALLVKGAFERVDEQGRPRRPNCGRVARDVAIPLLRTVDGRLAALSQPLSGQVAVRGEFARHVAFATGFGVEIAMLIDAWRAGGPSAVEEAHLGRIQNRWKPDRALDVVRRQVAQGAALRGVSAPGIEATPSPLVVDRHPA